MTGALEIEWAENLHEIHLDQGKAIISPESPKFETPTRPNFETLGLATALNKFSASIDRNNEVNAQKGKSDEENKTKK